MRIFAGLPGDKRQTTVGGGKLRLLVMSVTISLEPLLMKPTLLNNNVDYRLSNDPNNRGLSDTEMQLYFKICMTRFFASTVETSA